MYIGLLLFLFLFFSIVYIIILYLNIISKKYILFKTNNSIDVALSFKVRLYSIINVVIFNNNMLFSQRTSI